MGVTGLLPVLKPIQVTRPLAAYKDMTVAIDGYAWLHRAVYSCTFELAHDQPTAKYLQFFTKRIRALAENRVEPYFVFDGDDFALKKNTELQRAETRRLNKEEGLKLLSTGGGAQRSKAMDMLAKSVDVSPEIAKTVIDHLRMANIKYVVAPYEADLQMVYLEKMGIVDAVISEDSDLLVFGCRRLLTKYNDKLGTVVEINANDFSKLILGQLDQNQLRMMACISGCDYTSGIKGIGIKKAFQAVRHYNTMDKVLLKLKLDNFTVPKEFEIEYIRANYSFLYPRVFNPLEGKMDTLNKIPNEFTEDQIDLINECIGEYHDEVTHYKIAHGELHPITKKLLISREKSIIRQKPVQRSPSNPVVSAHRTLDTFSEMFARPAPTNTANISMKLPLHKKTIVKKSNIKTATMDKKILQFKQDQTEVSKSTKSKYFNMTQPVTNEEKLTKIEQVSLKSMTELFDDDFNFSDDDISESDTEKDTNKENKIPEKENSKLFAKPTYTENPSNKSNDSLLDSSKILTKKNSENSYSETSTKPAIQQPINNKLDTQKHINTNFTSDVHITDVDEFTPEKRSVKKTLDSSFISKYKYVSRKSDDEPKRELSGASIKSITSYLTSRNTKNIQTSVNRKDDTTQLLEPPRKASRRISGATSRRSISLDNFAYTEH